MVRLKGTSIFFATKRRFRFRGTVNCGGMTRKYMRELREDESYFSEVCLRRFIPVLTPLFNGKSCFSLRSTRTMGEGHIPQREIYVLLLGRSREGKELFMHLSSLNCL